MLLAHNIINDTASPAFPVFDVEKTTPDFVCSLCNKVFTRSYQLQLHMAKHAQVRMLITRSHYAGKCGPVFLQSVFPASTCCIRYMLVTWYY